MTGEKIRQEGRGRGIAQKREAEEKYGEERPDADSRRYEMRGKSMGSRWQGVKKQGALHRAAKESKR